MRRRPWPIFLLAWFHFLSPIGNFFFNAHYVPVDYWTYFTAHFDEVNLPGSIFFFLVPPMAGLAIYACKKWSFWVYLVLMLMIVAFSYHSWQTRPEINSIVPMVILFGINVTLVAYFLIPAVRTLYFDPRLRWWETKPRYSVDYSADVKSGDNQATAHILNLSESGLFLTVKQGKAPEDGARIDVTFKDQGTSYTVVGTAIHHQRQREMGIGVQFIHTSDSTRSLKFLTRKLETEGRRIPSRDPGPEDSFTFWFKGFIKGKGLIPRVEKKSKS